MVNDASFVNEVCRELLELRRPPVPTAPLPNAEETALQVAKSWTGLLLQAPFRPPADTPYVPAYADGGAFDILRVWYPTRLGEILVAQTLCVFAVVMHDGGARDVNATAKQMFQQGDRVRLVTSGSEGTASYGEQPPPEKDGHRDWMGHLRWWRDGDLLAFLTLKTAEAPGRAMMGWGPELNQYWFRLYEPQ
jgi:hypothetical protein